jgi:hypothetical protein
MRFSLGGIFLGMLSNKLRKRKAPFVLGGVCVVIGFGALYFVPDARLVILVPILLLGGFGSGSMVLGFLYAKESAPIRLSGAVAGAVNMGVMIGPLTQQPVTGWILDRHWDGVLTEGVRMYDLQAFKLAFAFSFVWVLSSFIALLLTR